MTYDAKVYGARGPLSDPPLLGEYLVVLAADAEAHEKAAVEAAYAEGRATVHGYKSGYFIGYAEGQRDMLAKCIAVLESELEACRDDDRIGGVSDSIIALRALKEKP